MTLTFREVDIAVRGDEQPPTLLIIDGETRSRDSLAATLSIEGFDIVTAEDGESGMSLAQSVAPSLILLDMQLPDSQGLALFRALTSTMPSVPVIMLTSREDELDAVLALEAGAADHVTKPPRPRELTARIRAVLRRVGMQPTLSPGVTQAEETPTTFSLGPVVIDLSLREATVRGEEVELSRKEFDLLTLLVSQAGHVVTRRQCMERIWKDHSKADSRTLDTHVKRLRKKVELSPADPRHIITIRGIGYRFKP